MDDQKRPPTVQDLVNSSAPVSASASSANNVQRGPDLKPATTIRRTAKDYTMQQYPGPIPFFDHFIAIPMQILRSSKPNLSSDDCSPYVIDATKHIVETYLPTVRFANSLIRHPLEDFKEEGITILEDLAPRTYPLTRKSLQELDSGLHDTDDFLKPNLWGMIRSNRVGTRSVRSMQSILTDESEEGIQFVVNVRVKDRNNEEWVLEALVDTGASRSFISGGTLSKTGPFREHPLPKDRRKVFSSPIGDTTTEPVSFIDVRLHFEGIVLESMHAKLRILIDTDKFEIILGRDFITKYRHKTNTSLLALLEQADQPNLGSTSGSGIFALRSVKKSPGMYKIPVICEHMLT
jgi:hypothetical protein